MAFVLQLAVALPSANRVEGDFISLHENEAGLQNESLIAAGFAHVIEIRNLVVEELDHLREVNFRPAMPGDSGFSVQDLEDRIFIIGPHRWNFQRKKLPARNLKEIQNEKITSMMLTETLISAYRDRQIFNRESFDYRVKFPRRRVGKLGPRRNADA